MSGIDYSKWDKLDCESSDSSDADHSSDSDEEHDKNTSHSQRNHNSDGAPQVTRLQYPTQVTLGPSGVQLTKSPPKASASPFHPSGLPSNAASAREGCGSANPPTLSHSNTPQTTSNNGNHHASSMTNQQDDRQGNEKGAGLDANDNGNDDDEDLLYESLARNGGREGNQHWWSQTQDSATVSFLVPWETTAKLVTRFSLREVKDTQTDQYRAQLEVTITAPSGPAAVPAGGEEGKENEDKEQTNTRVPPSGFHICQQFRYPIKLTEELIEGCWQLHRMPHRHLRLLVVEVFKEPIGQGMTLWWDRCFVSDTKSVIDTQKIADRAQRVSGATSASSQEKAEQFRKVWDEAHEEFRRRMKERKAKQN